MDILPGRQSSLWIATSPSTDYPAMPGNTLVDVAVLGGGITGLTTAMLLKEAGLTVAVIESDRIACKTSGHTTAKVTAAHGLIYQHLAAHFGQEGARLYADANQAAIQFVADRVADLRIACDFAQVPAFTYSESPDNVPPLRREYEAAAQAGLPVTWQENLDRPFHIAAALGLENQARFHVRRYLLAIAERIPGNGSAIFEQTRALEVREGEPCEIVTDLGSCRARVVVVATRYPFLLAGEYFTRLYPKQSYLLAATVDNHFPEGVYYEPGRPYHTFRSHPYQGGTLLLVGGEDHRTGHGGDTLERYRRVEEFARARFAVKAIQHYWSTEDNTTPDKVPYIGHLTRHHEKVFVAAGFGGWGMTHGTVAGLLLRDLILGRPNRWAELYNPSRLKLAAAGEFLGKNLHVAKEFVEGKLTGAGDAEPSQPEQAGKIATPEGTVAAYRDGTGGLYQVSATCTHLGCQVEWNPGELTWDCPCHGSRFAYDGRVVYGPAVKNLESKR